MADRRSMRRAVLAVTVVGAALVLPHTAPSAVGAAVATHSVAADDTPVCADPNVSLRKNSQPVTGDHQPFEAWFATEPAALEAVSSRLEEAGPHLLGVMPDNVQQQLLVIVDPDSGMMDDAVTLLSDLKTPFEVVVRPACRSVGATAHVLRDLQARKWHPTAPRVTYGFFLDPWTATIDVVFAPEATQAGSALEELHGELVKVAYGPVGRAGGSRTADTAPHYGGARVTDGTWNCSAGFAVRNGAGVRGMTTAAHCFTAGTPTITSGGNLYANGVWEPANFPTLDMAFMHGSTYTNVLWTDPCCPSTRNVKGAGDITTGTVCTSGATTTARCGETIINTNATLCDVSGCTPNLNVAEKDEVICQGGDSGGPVYTRPTTSSATIRGLIVGCEGFGRVMYHKVATVLNGLGVTVVKSA